MKFQIVFLSLFLATAHARHEPKHLRGGDEQDRVDYNIPKGGSATIDCGSSGDKCCYTGFSKVSAIGNGGTVSFGGDDEDCPQSKSTSGGRLEGCENKCSVSCGKTSKCKVTLTKVVADHTLTMQLVSDRCCLLCVLLVTLKKSHSLSDTNTYRLHYSKFPLS